MNLAKVSPFATSLSGWLCEGKGTATFEGAMVSQRSVARLRVANVHVPLSAGWVSPVLVWLARVHEGQLV